MKPIHLCLVTVIAFLAGCDKSTETRASKPLPRVPAKASLTELQIKPDVTSPPIVAAARSQVGVTTVYDPAYVRLDYPGGDVPVDRGVCTDVVIRALRKGMNMDLQKLVHEDMKQAFSQYPRIWGLTKPDRNIDHRRVPNLRTYFKRHADALSVSNKPEDYQPGDLVTCTVGRNLPHIMIVSDRKTATGIPLVIHNIGRGTKEEDCLFKFRITGHYRVRTSR